MGWKLVPRPRGREAESQVKCQCEISGTPFSNGEKLRPHSLPHPEQRPYSCPQLHCGKAFASKYKLYRHMATHSAQKPHQCMYCDKMFHRKDHLRNHLQTHDPNKEALHCSECGKNYNTKLGYRRHLAMHAASSGDLSCKVCLQTFESTQALLEHLKAHSRLVAGGAKEKKHPCDHCDRRFYTRKDVRRHLVVHTGRKDFLCQYCAQRFGRKDHLTRHVKKSHSQELLKIKTEPVDMLGLLSCSSTVSVKEELSPVLCMASRDVMGAKAFPGMLPMGMYGAHIPTMPSAGMPHSLVHNTLPMGMSYPLESSPISSSAQLPPNTSLDLPHTCPTNCPKWRWIVFWQSFLEACLSPRLNLSPPHLSRRQLQPSWMKHCSPRVPPTSPRPSALLMWTFPTYWAFFRSTYPHVTHQGPQEAWLWATPKLRHSLCSPLCRLSLKIPLELGDP